MVPLILFCPASSIIQVAEDTRFHMIHFPGSVAEGESQLVQGRNILCSERMLTSWASPVPAIALFLDGFPEDPRIREQAMGRVVRYPVTHSPNSENWETLKTKFSRFDSGQLWK